MAAKNFYSDLPSFSDFETVGQVDGYQPVPEDWYVIAADIVNSSKAIAAGQYKHVNMVGAAVIAAVINRLGREKTPFVFGGDGAMLLVPKEYVDEASDALSGVVDLSKSVMGLKLRAAAIPVSTIRENGGDIRIRKYRLSPGNHLAMIIGDGLIIADDILKDEQAISAFEITSHGAQMPSLDGLSCRWEPLASKNGQIVSLIVKPAKQTDLSQIMHKIADHLGYNPLIEDENTRLAEEERLRFKFPPSGLKTEVVLVVAQSKLKGWVKTLIECLVFVAAKSTGKRIGPFDPKRYFKELSLNTDHRKIGDSLQFVLDLTQAQVDAISAHLQNAYERGELVYGMHVSKTALMTCFVEDIGNSQHIHFVDGANGGLSSAALEFKKRLKLFSRVA